MRLNVYRTARKLLAEANLNSYEEASVLLASPIKGRVNIAGKPYDFKIYSTGYFSDEDIMLVCCLSRRGAILDGDNIGYLFRKDNSKKYYSQKMLWDYGF